MEVKIECSPAELFLSKLDSQSVDLTVTSPPYDNLRKYRGFSFPFEEIATQLFRVTKEGSVIVWIVADSCINGGEYGTSFKQALFFMNIGFKLYDTMIWLKPSPQAPTEGRYYDVFEYMFVFSKGKPSTLNLLKDRKNKSFGSISKKETRSCKEDRNYKDGTRIVPEFSRRFNVWEMSRGKNTTSHPAVFPEKLAHDHIFTWSNEGDTVMDCFLGSGTVAKIALKLNRKFIGCDISQEYIDIANERIEPLLNEINFKPKPHEKDSDHNQH